MESSMRAASLLVVVAVSIVLPRDGGRLYAQQASAPIDLTGTWVSVISEDWHLRMITPPKSNFEGMTVNDAARKIAAAWDPARDEAEGNACRAYGAGGI